MFLGEYMTSNARHDGTPREIEVRYGGYKGPIVLCVTHWAFHLWVYSKPLYPVTREVEVYDCNL